MSKSTEEYFTPIHHLIAKRLGYKQTPGYATWDKVEETAPVQVIDRLAQLFDQELAKRVEEASKFVIGDDPDTWSEKNPHHYPIELVIRQEIYDEQRKRLATLNNQTNQPTGRKGD